MSAVGKRRRSPRLSKSPPPKRKKLERKETVEVEEQEVDACPKRKVIERKTTSFLEDMNKDDNIAGVVASLSSCSQKKLMKSLSSIINPTESTDPEPIVLSRMEGIDQRYTFEKYVEDAGPCWLELPFDFLLQLISLLPAREAWKFGQSCRYTMTLLTSFSSELNLPIRERSTKGSKSVNIPGFYIRSYTAYNAWNFLDKKKDEEEAMHATAAINYIRKLSSNTTHVSEQWERPERGLVTQRGCVGQPEGLSLQLYDYQAQGLTWMLTIEGIVRKKKPIIFSTLLSIPGRPNLVMDTNKRNSMPFLVTKDCYKQAEYTDSLRIQGGIFADEMGLGKTISMIALILSNPIQSEEDGSIALCAREEELCRFQSKATLIICPSTLVDQWASEIENHTSLTCHTVATAAQHKKIRYSTVMRADIIIVASKFLWSNRKYEELQKQYQTMSPEASHVSPLFQLFHWHRIIIDEAHEIVLELGALENFHSTYRWYVSGTPFPDRNRMKLALSFLGEKEGNGQLYSFLKRRALKNSIFWRNTKRSVGRQVEIPPVVERVQIVYLSPVEQAIHDSLVIETSWCSERKCREFISNPSGAVTICAFDDPLLPQKYIEHYNKKIERVREAIKGRHERAAKIDNAEAKVEYWRRNKSNIEANERQIIGHLCSRACFVRLSGEGHEKCDNCCEVSPSLYKIPCGHDLCMSCIDDIQKEEEKICLKCNSGFVMSAVRPLDIDHEVPALGKEQLFGVPESCDEVLNEMRSKHGSKMAATVEFIVKIIQESDAKMIVFSQYEASLNHLVSILKELDYELFENAIVQLKGNSHVRKKRLARFNGSGDDAARIITMSLQNSSSGTHLAAASHVLLLDPVVGSTGDALATDAQAIARAHRLGQLEPVQAIRFIVARTIDQKDYEKAYGPVIRQTKGLGPKSARK